MLRFNVNILLDESTLIDTCVVSCPSRKQGQSDGVLEFKIDRGPSSISVEPVFSVKDLTVGREAQAIRQRFREIVGNDYQVVVTARTELDDKVEHEMSEELTKLAEEEEE